MKKLRILTGLLSVVLLLSACSKEKGGKSGHFSIPSIPSQTSESQGLVTEPAYTTSVESSAETEPSETTTKKAITHTQFTQQTEIFPGAPVYEVHSFEKQAYSYQQVTIDEQEIWNQDGLVITAYGFEIEGEKMFDVFFRIENHSDKAVTLSSSDIDVDGYKTTTMFYESVEAGATSDSTCVFFFAYHGEYMNIWQPHLIEISFEVEFDDGNVKTAFTTPFLPIQTSLYGQEQQVDLSWAPEICNDGTLLVRVLDCYESNGDAVLVLYCENLSEHKLSISDKELWFDGADVGLISFSLLPGKKGITSVTIFDTRRIEYGITEKIQRIDLQMKYYLDDDYVNSVELPPVCLKIV